MPGPKTALGRGCVKGMRTWTSAYRSNVARSGRSWRQVAGIMGDAGQCVPMSA